MQFHVYRLPNGRLVLDLQADFIDTGTRVVAPLYPITDGPAQMDRLEPILEVEDEDHVLHIAEMAAIPSRLLAVSSVANLTARDYEIRRALDMVFSGF